MKDDFKDLTFNLEDFEDYKKEIEEIKELYTGLMKKKSVKKNLIKYLKNRSKKEFKINYNTISEEPNNYTNEIIANQKLKLSTINDDNHQKFKKGLC